MNNQLEGGCACGAVRYRLTSAPMFVHCCHCRDCQRQTGSAFVLKTLIETDQTALWSDYGGRPALRFVRIGTLDDPAALQPDVHIYTRSKVPWVALPEGVPAYEVYYDTNTLWPAESLARRRAILGGS